jgi:hypothetical protein
MNFINSIPLNFADNAQEESHAIVIEEGERADSLVIGNRTDAEGKPTTLNFFYLNQRPTFSFIIADSSSSTLKRKRQDENEGDFSIYDETGQFDIQAQCIG